MKNHMPQGWTIPQYRTLKSKLPKYRLKKAQYRNTVNPHAPSARILLPPCKQSLTEDGLLPVVSEVEIYKDFRTFSKQ